MECEPCYQRCDNAAEDCRDSIDEKLLLMDAKKNAGKLPHQRLQKRGIFPTAIFLSESSFSDKMPGRCEEIHYKHRGIIYG